MWQAFRNSTLKEGNAPQATIVYDKFHILMHLAEAMDQVRRREYARVSGKDRRFIKGQRYTLLSHWENLNATGREALTLLFKANRRLNKAYLLKESFDQLWDYWSPGWARRFFDQWRAALRGNVWSPSSVSPAWCSALGRDRGLLPRGEQGAVGFRGRHQQQDPCHPEAGVRLPG